MEDQRFNDHRCSSAGGRCGSCCSALLFTDLGIYSLLVAMIIYAVVVCILNDRAMKNTFDIKIPGDLHT